MNHSKLTKLVLLSALAFPGALLAQGSDSPKPDPEIEKAVLKVTHEMTAALTKPDVDAAAKMLADSYYAVTPDGGTVNKTEFLADLKSGKFKLESNKLDDIKVHATSPDLAIVTYRSTDKGTYDGHDISGQYRWLDIFAKRNGTWQYIVSQGTPIEQPTK